MKSTNQSIKRNPIILIIATTAISTASITQAEPPWDQTQKLLASDGAASDQFGRSVAVSGNTAVIGAKLDDDNGTQSGSAYVFDLTTGQQLFKLLPTDGAVGDEFGNSVAVSGNTAVIGAWGDDGLGTDSGSAYVFDVSTGQQLFKLLATDGTASDSFGNSVAISGNTAVIGAEFDDDFGTDSGSAYVFDITTGQQLFKLLATDGEAYNRFGFSVAVSGNIAVIGAVLGNGNVAGSGSAYVFDITTGRQLFKLLATDGAAADEFGISVALSGNTAVIGAVLGNGNVADSGSAYVFDITTGGQLFKLLATDGAEGDLFGNSVAISGNTAVIGAESDGDSGYDSGSAYVFDITTGEQLFKLLANDGAARDYFGGSVAVSGNIAVIGAESDDDRGTSSGSAYIFEQQRTPNLLTITPDPLIAKQDGTFNITQALPNQRTGLIYSLDGLQKIFIRQLNVVIDLANPKLATGPKLTDVNGDLQFILPMPGILGPLNVWFQAVQQRNVTNFVATQLIP